MDHVNKRLDRLEHHVFGNGTAGLDETVRRLLERDTEVRQMLQEWSDTKAQWKGARKAVITVGVVVSVLGGGLGIAILQAVAKVAAGLP